VISDYIQDLKKAEGDGAKLYPLDKEDELLAAMQRGDKKSATGLLNQILGHIFFYSGLSMDVIRSRVVELVALLSRAAVKGGADMEAVLGMNYTYLNEVDKVNSIEDLAYWLSLVMNRYMDTVFPFVAVKHVNTIYKAVDFIRSNYMNKITLEETAQYVYLSPAYFSKIFKEETKSNFNVFLNNIRIEQAKKLLLNDNINLSDISNIVGYEDQSYFTKVFKRVTGVSPGRFRQARGNPLREQDQEL
jgi:AraC-like DNA-binding protein